MDRPLTDAERFPLLGRRPRASPLAAGAPARPPVQPPLRRPARCRGAAAGARLRRGVPAGPPRLELGSDAGVAGSLPPVLPGGGPYYRRYGETGDYFALPTTRREDLVREPWSFVPDSQPLDDLILYRSSQTTGECVTVLSHPEVPARDLPLLEELLRNRGVTLEGGSERVSLLMSCAQTHTITYPMVLSYLGDAGFAKINLNPVDWRDPEDRVKFLDDCDPELYSGDPIAFHELMQLPLRKAPKALVSTAMTLVPAFRGVLEAHFRCPVLDLYALNETGIITADDGGGHTVLPHDMYVEVLGPAGEACPPGERGEIVVTGGNNPFLPLLRYRTGDWAAMAFDGATPRLEGVRAACPRLFPPGGRGPGRLPRGHDSPRRLPDSRVYPAPGTGRLAPVSRARTRNAREALRQALDALFGPEHPVQIEELPPPYEWGGKLLQYPQRRAYSPRGLKQRRRSPAWSVNGA